MPLQVDIDISNADWPKRTPDTMEDLIGVGDTTTNGKSATGEFLKSVLAKSKTDNCGTGAGGFKPGNTCAGSEPGDRKDIPESGKQTDSAEFKAWFGDSKVVDDNGEPLMVFHGTQDLVVSFDVDHPNRQDTGWLGTGVYLTTNADIASSYATLKQPSREAGPNVLPLYAKLENPFEAAIEDKRRIQVISHNEGSKAGLVAADLWTKELIRKGHDGVLLRFPRSKFGEESTEYVVFDPTQIKSAIGNSGTFDPDNPDITKSKRTAVAGAADSEVSGEPGIGSSEAGDSRRARQLDLSDWRNMQTPGSPFLTLSDRDEAKTYRPEQPGESHDHVENTGRI